MRSNPIINEVIWVGVEALSFILSAWDKRDQCWWMQRRKNTKKTRQECTALQLWSRIWPSKSLSTKPKYFNFLGFYQSLYWSAMPGVGHRNIPGSRTTLKVGVEAVWYAFSNLSRQNVSTGASLPQKVGNQNILETFTLPNSQGRSTREGLMSMCEDMECKLDLGLNLWGYKSVYKGLPKDSKQYHPEMRINQNVRDNYQSFYNFILSVFKATSTFRATIVLPFLTIWLWEIYLISPRRADGPNW